MTETTPSGPPEPGAMSRLARIARQRLEIDRLFGWELPLSRSRLLPAARSEGERMPAAAAAELATRRAAAEGGPADPAALLAPLAAEVAGCTRCELCRKRTNTVFGTGNPRARIFFVGEGPGEDEDLQGEPFVGAAGQLLDRIITAMGLRRADVYIANVVKCRPPENRTPHPVEVDACFPYLEKQIEIVEPEAIIALGATAARSLLRTDASITRLRNRFHEFRGIPLVATYHPAYLLRDPSEKRKVWEDVQLVMARLGLAARGGPALQPRRSADRAD